MVMDGSINEPRGPGIFWPVYKGTRRHIYIYGFRSWNFLGRGSAFLTRESSNGESSAFLIPKPERALRLMFF